MSDHHIKAALARDRQNSFLAEAAAARRVKQARQHRKRAGTSVARRTPLRSAANWLLSGHSRGKARVMLRDGSAVLIRPAQSDDMG